ncbi:Hsp20/alpha crystallin family protein [Aliisedimentitalea scapharcae]|uniref:Hsp20/alpha crystallin family protein n=1 Tax=Aliisedimentitalea scapharcae TaxID=1524259 RepID=A0ABZ2XZK7_9RHOB
MVEKTETGGFWPSLYDPLRAFGTRVSEWLNPATEASGNAQAYDISIELPGVSEQDIELTFDNGALTIRGEKKTQTEKTGDTWYFSERQYGAFRRTFRLPEDADGPSAHARMLEGVLHVKIPRKAPEQEDKAQRIEITRG